MFAVSVRNANDFPFFPVHLSEPPGRTGLVQGHTGLGECSWTMFLRPSVLGVIRCALHVPSLAWCPFRPFLQARWCQCSLYSVQSLSHVLTLCNPMNRSTPGLPVHHKLRSLLKFMSIESVMASSQLILCHPLLLLPPIPPSIRVFSNESTLRMRWPKYWSFNLSISPSNVHPGLICLRMDWLDLLAVQGTLKSLFQTIIQKNQFFGAQLSSQSNSHIHTWPMEKP